MEDAEKKTPLVERLLSGEHSCKIQYSTHLNIRTSKQLRLSPKEGFWHKPRGVEQRNFGIDWLSESASEGLLGDPRNPAKLEGVVYFGDDDNTYDVEVFKEVCACTYI